MHETILKTLAVGVVGGLIVYYLTSQREHAHATTSPCSYKPNFGDVRTVRFGSPTCADCQCCGLPTPQNTTNPLAADYLDCYPEHAPATSKWNIGVSLQVSCDRIDAEVFRKETATTFPHGVAGIRSTPPPLVINGDISCNPCVSLQIECTETV